MKKAFAECCRVLIGAVFIFSGAVKAIDPVGGAIKLDDYFNAFGLEALAPFALMLSFCLASFEFALGVCMLTGVYRRYVSLLVLLFMCFMTPLTFYLAVADPVSDCGCFGDALVITNWETFYKNIVLLVAAIVVFLWNQRLLQVYTFKVYWFVALYAYVFCLGFAYANYRNLPIVDFRPYKVGANINRLMEIPEGAPQAEYRYSFIYEKDGVQKEFTLDNYPANDSTWTFVDQKSELIRPGYEPAVKDFIVYDADGTDITDLILNDDRGVFLLISPDLDKANDSRLEEINDLYDYAHENGYAFYCLTASTPDAIRKWVENTGAEYPFCMADETVLKTMIRSNPGLMLLKGGTILAKWSYSQLPGEEQLKPVISGYLGETAVNAKEGRHTVAILSSFILPLLLVFVYDYFVNRRRRKREPEAKSK
ncbi:MAG: DoxX family protein [Parabacteroides sp.]|nr:DoxX family protein [Parabacteroides sp.]